MDEENQNGTQATPQPQKKQQLSKIGIIIVIIVVTVLLLIAIGTFLYEPYNEEPETTPDASITVTYTDTPGKYYLIWSGLVEESKIDISVYDYSLDRTEVEEKPSGDPSGLLIQVPGGCNLKWYDNNDDDKLDGSDTLIMEGAAPGDRVIVTYRPTKETVATCTIH